MATKLYVGGLPYSTTQDELQSAFAQAGAVTSTTIIIDKMTGRSRGFGFVEMGSDEDAQKAIEMWNGKDFGGRKLTVNEAKPLEAACSPLRRRPWRFRRRTAELVTPGSALSQQQKPRSNAGLLVLLKSTHLLFVLDFFNRLPAMVVE